MKTLFQGEWMICDECGKQEKSDPNTESGWTVLEIENQFLYWFCPDCWNEYIKIIGKNPQGLTTNTEV